MIPVPQPVLESLANCIGTKAAHLGYFGDGDVEGLGTNSLGWISRMWPGIDKCLAGQSR
jgi:hypothetical protein